MKKILSKILKSLFFVLQKCDISQKKPDKNRQSYLKYPWWFCYEKDERQSILWFSEPNFLIFYRSQLNCWKTSKDSEKRLYYLLVGMFMNKIKIFVTIDRDIHIECSKQFKWNSYFYVSGQSRPFWAALKLL